MSLNDNLTEYHGLVAQSVAVLDKDLGLLEDKVEALKQENKRISKELEQSQAYQEPRIDRSTIAIVMSAVAIAVSIISTLL